MESSGGNCEAGNACLQGVANGHIAGSLAKLENLKSHEFEVAPIAFSGYLLPALSLQQSFHRDFARLTS